MNQPPKAVFLSYASQDSEAARKICESLRQAGVEVWFDADGGLEHGDEWDAKIRKQIKECVLFIPIISAHTQARHEGYFRLEWDLAAERARTIASGVAFILPVVIDETREPEALVPDRFRTVQWTRLPLRQAQDRPVGDIPPEVTQRFLKLWSHRTGAAASRGLETKDQGPGTSEPDERAPVRANRLDRRRLGVRVTFAVTFAAVALVVAAAVWQPWKLDRPGAMEPTAAKSGVRASRPEVAALLARARALCDKTDVVRTELDTAAGLLEQAAKLDATDADVWAQWALVDWRYVEEHFDRSRARLDLARRHATQAMGLDSSNPMARLADAATMVLLNNDAPTKEAAIAILEPLVDRLKDHGGALLLLGRLKWDPARPELVAGYFDRAARVPGWAVRAEIERAHRFAFSSFRYQEAEDAVDRGLAVERAAYLINYKLFFLFAWQGDVAAAQRLMAEIPAAMLGEDFYGSGRYCVELRARQYERAVSALRAIPRDYMESFAYAGPTGYYIGYALARAGKAAAAEIEWRAALDLVNRRLAASPKDQDLLLFKALLLSALGDKPGGEKIWRSTRELFGDEIVLQTWPGYFCFLEFLPDEAAIEQLNEMVSKGQPWAMAGSLRLDPYLDRLRSHPKFVALLARAEADPRLSPKAAKQSTGDRGQRSQGSGSRGQKSEDGHLKSGAAQPRLDFAPLSAVGSAKAEAKSIAVLAFENLSGDKDNEYFSDGISEELLNVLAKVPGLRVAARTSAFYFKGKNATAQEIGQKLGVAHLVDGSVRRAGTKVRIAARLSKAETGEQLWGEAYERELKDVFAVQTELAETIVERLRGQLGGSGATVKAEIQAQVQAAEIGGTRHVEAHELYLQGTFFLNQFTVESAVRAAEFFRRAVERDGNFASAWAALARAGWIRSAYGTTRRDFTEGLNLAREAADRAVALQPKLAVAHLARFDLQSGHDFDWKAAVESLRQALSLAPNDARAVLSASMLATWSDQRERAVELARQAVGLDPVNASVRLQYAFALAAVRRFEESDGEFRQASELSPSAPWGHAGVALNRIAQERFDEAVAEAAAEKTEWARLFALAIARWGQGNRGEADDALARLTASADVAAYQVAQIHAFRRQNDLAFEWLERALMQRDSGLAWSRADWLFLVHLHSDPRWPRFVKKVGLDDESLK